MKVIAKERGFYQGRQIATGTVFDFDVEKDGKRDVKRDEDGKPLRNENGDRIPDPHGEKLIPEWTAEANDENVEQYGRIPFTHPTLDDEGRPYPYSIPYVQPGATAAPMGEVAKAVNDVQDAATQARDEEAEKTRVALEGEPAEPLEGEPTEPPVPADPTDFTDFEAPPNETRGEQEQEREQDPNEKEQS